jgi:hypothetical protein
MWEQQGMYAKFWGKPSKNWPFLKPVKDMGRILGMVLVKSVVKM